MYFVANARMGEKFWLLFDLLPLFGVKPDKLVKELNFCFLFLCKVLSNINFPNIFLCLFWRPALYIQKREQL